ncbi:septal ring lytic transglycosylase RlpA family protein [Methylobacterium organophilum]|uniref:septal ring lytic transglycosylase RlpA family protein n=1 Tax=Methylobacterium organophilum TaxID=410 RepID=UPI001F13D057|nr:septal ring lytic transglycosylase RlpA family protein [Methylobacterium organophilum]UMY16598.1 septal ring lytic transglycosylase RlpA family protein [Methylobacterium organophilum]
MAGVEKTGKGPFPYASALPPFGAPFWKLLGVCAVALTTANCSTNPQKLAGASGGNGIDPKYGVRASRRLYNEGDVIPKGGGRRFSGKPYVVAGKTYVPREEARGYVRQGLASWYGSAFHGRMTANGEVFDRHSIAAAHPTLPLPSYARVTNLDNGYSMVVRVNDRGPYHAGRVMDVSEEAARALDFHRRGTAHVRVEYVGKASTAGSDDRRLLATLRTDGRPAGISTPVMMADLGPDTDPDVERFTRPEAAPLAFKPKDEEARETGTAEAPEPAPAPRPARPAPVMVASAASVAVPAALQPTARRAAPFRPAPSWPARPRAPPSRRRKGRPAASTPRPRRSASPPLRSSSPPRPPAGRRWRSTVRARRARRRSATPPWRPARPRPRPAWRPSPPPVRARPSRR